MAFRKPISVNISQVFGVNQAYYKTMGMFGHNGHDYAAAAGTPVYAADEGTVAYEGWGQSHSWMGQAAGICVLINNGGLYSGYAHLNASVVNRSQNVSKGQLIGYVGSTGASTGPHLHFEAMPLSPNFRNGYAGRIDPQPYMEINDRTGRKVVNTEDLDYIYQYGPLSRPRSAGEGEDVYLGKTAAFVINDHRNSVEGRAKAAEVAEAFGRPQKVTVEKPVEVIKEVVKEVKVEVVKEVPVVKEVVKNDADRSLGELLIAAFNKLFKVK